MWSKSDELRFSVVVGLREGLRLVRGMRGALTEEDRRAIVQHLEGTNWKIEKGPPLEGYGQHLGPK
jgi:hypothetical protein